MPQSSAEHVFFGEVQWFNNTKGFGFIVRADGKGTIFVHHSNISCSGYRTLREGQKVAFKIGPGLKNHGTQALDVAVLDGSDVELRESQTAVAGA